MISVTQSYAACLTSFQGENANTPKSNGNPHVCLELDTPTTPNGSTQPNDESSTSGFVYPHIKVVFADTAVIAFA